MTARHCLTVLAALSASLAVTAAEAQSKKKGGGGWRRAAPFGGAVLPWLHHHRRQDLRAPRPVAVMPLGIGVSVSGTPTDSPCGPAIRVSSWKADNTVKCRTR